MAAHHLPQPASDIGVFSPFATPHTGHFCLQCLHTSTRRQSESMLWRLRGRGRNTACPLRSSARGGCVAAARLRHGGYTLSFGGALCLVVASFTVLPRPRLRCGWRSPALLGFTGPVWPRVTCPHYTSSCDGVLAGVAAHFGRRL